MNFDVAPLFSTPLYISKFDVSEEDKQKLYSLAYERTGEGNGGTTVDKNVLYLPELAHIKTELEKRFHEYADNVLGVDRFREEPPLEFFVMNAWVMKHKRGDWGHKHSHQNAIFSGIIYLNVDDNTGDITFHDKDYADKVFPSMFHIPLARPSLYSAVSMTFKPKNGDLFIFPSHLQHSIGLHESDITRYALAFNFWLRGKLGQYTGELIL